MTKQATMSALGLPCKDAPHIFRSRHTAAVDVVLRRLIKLLLALASSEQSHWSHGHATRDETEHSRCCGKHLPRANGRSCDNVNRYLFAYHFQGSQSEASRARYPRWIPAEVQEIDSLELTCQAVCAATYCFQRHEKHRINSMNLASHGSRLPSRSVETLFGWYRGNAIDTGHRGV
jgi:hypothetical protein